MFLLADKSLLLQVAQASLIVKFLKVGGELDLTFGKTSPEFSNTTHCRIYFAGMFKKILRNNQF